MGAKYIILLAVVIGTACAQSELESSIRDSIPPEFQGKFNETQIEQITNTSTALFKEKCEKNGGPEVFEKVQEAYKNFPSCLQRSLNLSNLTVIQNEIDVAKLNGTVDEVFKKYCAKSPQAKDCLNSTLETAKPCFTEAEQKNLKVIYNITDQLIGFICFKDGDRIALFIAEGGPDCYQERVEQIQDCVNKTFGSDYQFNTNDLTANTIPEIKFDEKECRQLTDLQACVVEALEQCKTPTSANIIESLFNFIRKATPCKPTEVIEATPRSRNNETKPDSASGLAAASMTIAAALGTVLLL